MAAVRDRAEGQVLKPVRDTEGCGFYPIAEGC